MFEVGSCGTCPAAVIWAESEKTGAAMPVDAQPVQGGTVRLVERPGQRPLAQVVRADLAFGATNLRTAHFATCPDAARHRRRAARSQS